MLSKFSRALRKTNSTLSTSLHLPVQIRLHAKMVSQHVTSASSAYAQQKLNTIKVYKHRGLLSKSNFISLYAETEK